MDGGDAQTGFSIHTQRKRSLPRLSVEKLTMMTVKFEHICEAPRRSPHPVKPAVILADAIGFWGLRPILADIYGSEPIPPIRVLCPMSTPFMARWLQ